nr:XdhC/CoxI family protein [Pelagicoccus albus]
MKRDNPVFIGIVARCSKGSPGTPKARIIVRTDGSQYGTIGGGIMELSFLELARSTLEQKDFKPQLRSVYHRRESNAPSGLICGGGQTNVLAVLYPDRDLQTVETIIDALEKETAQTISISSQGLSLHNNVQHGQLTPTLRVLGEDWFFEESCLNPKRIAIFGAGHCGQALAAQMLRLGYHVSLTDQRAGINIDHSCKDADRLIGIHPSEAKKRIQHWKQTQVVVMTHSYPTDLDALLEVLPLPVPFIGLMGSPPKLRKIRLELREKGLGQDLLAKLRAPVGLAIGSDTPEEIAVSVAAQLIQENSTRPLNEPDFADNVSTK